METKNRGRRRGTISLQSVVATAFLGRFGQLHSMPCPTGRGSGDESCVRYLPSSTLPTEVYERYCDSWGDIMTAVMNGKITAGVEPMLKKSFLRVWREKVPTLRIFKRGSDFCDTCTFF